MDSGAPEEEGERGWGMGTDQEGKAVKPLLNSIFLPADSHLGASAAIVANKKQCRRKKQRKTHTMVGMGEGRSGQPTGRPAFPLGCPSPDNRCGWPRFQPASFKTSGHC
jgi:hypothetical protein